MDEHVGAGALDIAASVARRYRARGVWWAELDEMRAVAATAIVNAWRLYDPAVGVAWEAYAYTSGAFAVKRWLWDTSGPVAVPESRTLDDLRATTRGVLDPATPTREPRPDDACVDAEWRASVRALVEEYAAPDGARDADMALAVLLRDETPADVAATYGVRAADVSRAVRRVRARMEQSADLYELWKEARNV